MADKVTNASSLQRYLVKGVGRGGGISEVAQRRKNDQRVGGGKDTDDLGQSNVNKHAGTMKTKDIAREKGESRQFTEAGCAGITSMDFNGEKLDLYEDADEEEKGSDVEMAECDGNTLLIEAEMAKLEEELRVGGIKEKKGSNAWKEIVVGFWETRLREIALEDTSEKSDEEKKVRNRIQEAIEFRIKAAFLAREEGNDDEPMAETGGNQEVIIDLNMEDISDDETVITSSSSKKHARDEDVEEEGWKTVISKGNKEKEKKNRTNSTSAHTNSNSKSERKLNKSEKKEDKPNKKSENLEANYSKRLSEDPKSNKSTEKKLPTFLEKLKEKKRLENEFSVRVNFSFNPKTGSNGELKRIAVELMEIACRVDNTAMINTWDEQSAEVNLGAIKLIDLMNPNSFVQDIQKYINKPRYVTLQPGTTAYKLGVRFSVSVDKYQFLRGWNALKQIIKEERKNFYPISLAPMQESPNAFLIGIAAGSSEDQDTELLNQRLADATGIAGIEVSFQNINQSGITNEFWRLANEKAAKTRANKMSREYLRCKFKWAPNALAIYVPNATMVNEARKQMIKMYGQRTNQGDPVWPDGTQMRFLPLKNGVIRSEKTKSIVKKRLAFHIWNKAHDRVMMTDFVNIHKGDKVFEGKTFSEIILEMRSSRSGNKPLFKHFKRGWNPDPQKEVWLLAVDPNSVAEANERLRGMKQWFESKYGEDALQFFEGGKQQGQVNSNDEDDDGWFQDDDEIDELIKKGDLQIEFIHFLNGKTEEEDRESVVSWGTGNTNYTDIETVIQEAASVTATSSITVSADVSAHEVEIRKQQVRDRLREMRVDEYTIDSIFRGTAPYELVMSGISSSAWRLESEMFLINLIRAHQTTKSANKNDGQE